MTTPRFSWQILGLTLFAAALATAAPGLDPVDPEFQVNTYTTGDQGYPAACVQRDGGTVIVWESRDQDGDGNAVRAQRLDAAGAPLGSELAVNSYTTGQQQLASVSCTGGGEFVVVWESEQDGDDYGIIGRRFTAEGASFGSEFQINTTTEDRQSGAATCSNAAGDFVVAWQSYYQDGDGYGIFARTFGADGAPRSGEFQVNTYADYSQENPAVACGDDGQFVVVWDGGAADGDGYGIFAQRIDGDGNKVGTEFQVNTYTTGSQQIPSVGAAADGSFVVVWESYDDQDGDGYGIFGRRYAEDGAPSGSEFQVNAYTLHSQQKPSVGVAPDGAFTVAWSSPHAGDDYDVFARNFDSAGVPTGTADFLVNTYTAGDQGALSPEGHVLSVVRGAGQFTVVWQSIGVNVAAQDGDGSGIYAQRFTTGGAACPGDCDGSGAIAINELIIGVGIVIESLPLSRCDDFDLDSSGTVTINELISAVNAALSGCP